MTRRREARARAQVEPLFLETDTKGQFYAQDKSSGVIILIYNNGNV